MKTHKDTCFFFFTKSTLTFFLTNPNRSYLKHTNRIYMWQIPIGSTWQIPIDSNRQIRIDSIWQIPMITIVSLFWLHPLALHCDQIILSGGGYSLLTEISTNVIMVNDKMILFTFGRKHCQRHNGPEGWVHLAKVTSWGYITNLDHILSSESRLSIN